MKDSKPGIGGFKRKTFVRLFFSFSTTFIPLQARNQKFFRAGEFSWN